MSFSEAAQDLLSIGEQEDKFFGKYRGIVLQNADPEFRGRIQVQVAGVVMPPSTWAEPCVPVAGMQCGFFAVPPIGAGVWVEFEQGDPDYPIWVGGFWGTPAEPPLTAKAAATPTPDILMQTIGNNSITIYGAPGLGVTLAAGPVVSPTSPRIMITQAGIVITDGMGGMINVAGGVVTVNLGALIVK
jgi:hypothetical protein